MDATHVIVRITSYSEYGYQDCHLVRDVLRYQYIKITGFSGESP